MFRSLYTAASGMEAQEMNLDNIANNLANANSTGFRSRRLHFEDMIYQNTVTPGAPAKCANRRDSRRLQVGLGSRPVGHRSDSAAGQF